MDNSILLSVFIFIKLRCSTLFTDIFIIYCLSINSINRIDIFLPTFIYLSIATLCVYIYLASYSSSS